MRKKVQKRTMVTPVDDGDSSGLASDSSDESSDELLEIITEEFLFTAPHII